MGTMVHDPGESPLIAGAVSIVVSPAQVSAVRVAMVGKVEHTLVVVEEGKQVAVQIVGTKYQHTHKEEQ